MGTTLTTSIPLPDFLLPHYTKYLNRSDCNVENAHSNTDYYCSNLDWLKDLKACPVFITSIPESGCPQEAGRNEQTPRLLCLFALLAAFSLES